MLFQHNKFVDLILFLLNTTVLIFTLVDSVERKRRKRKRLDGLEKQKLKIERIIIGIEFFSSLGFLIGLLQGLFYDTTVDPTVERSFFFIISLIFLGIMITCIPLCIILDKIERKIESLKRSEVEREISSAGITKRRFDLKFYVLLLYLYGGLFFLTILIWGNFNVIFVGIFVIGFWTSILISILIVYVFPIDKNEK
ncbi:MAG: hypothetical protein ACTSQP_02310 [Promethearchaeota archaeon]